VDVAEPTVLWRLFKKPGHRSLGEGGGPGHARAVILPGGPPHTLAFFANDQMDRVENFDALEIALFRADEIKQSLTADGWHED
jgi:hypothetical protein